MWFLFFALFPVLLLAQDNESQVVQHAATLIQANQPFDAALELEDFVKSHPDAVAAGKLYAGLLVDVVDDRKKAEEVLQHLAKVAPQDAEVWSGLAKLYLGRREPTEAARCFREAARLDAASPLYAAGIARSLEEAKQIPEAEAEYKQALRLNSAAKRPEPLVCLFYAGFLLKNNRQAESIEYYGKALAASPHLAEAYQGRASAYEQLGDLKKAEADALAAIREQPSRKDARQLLIRVYRSSDDEAKLQQQAEALQKIVDDEQAKLASGREMRAALNEAEKRLAEGKYPEAVAAYERVIAASPEFYEAYFGLGAAYQQTGQLQKAEQALRRYLQYQPLSPDGHVALGLTYAAENRASDARIEIERALELNPSLADPSLERAYAALLLACSSTDECKVKAIEALRRNPRSLSYFKAVTSMLIDKNPIDVTTVDMAERMHKMFPEDPEAAFLYAKWAHAANRLDLALAESSKLAGNPALGPAMQARAFTLRGLTEARLEHPDQAEQAYRQALVLNRTLTPPDPQMALHYVDFLVAASRAEEADKLVSEMLAWSPSFAPALLRRAVYLDGQGRQRQAIEQASKITAQSGADPQVLRAAHALLARTYAELGQSEAAKVHEDWITSHP